MNYIYSGPRAYPDNGLRSNWSEPEPTAKSKGLFVFPEWKQFGAGVPVHSTETPDGPQVESKFQLHNI